MTEFQFMVTIRCAHCHEALREHVEGKCLYGPERFVALACAFSECRSPIRFYHAVLILEATGECYHRGCQPGVHKDLFKEIKPQ